MVEQSNAVVPIAVPVRVPNESPPETAATISVDDQSAQDDSIDDQSAQDDSALEASNSVGTHAAQDDSALEDSNSVAQAAQDDSTLDASISVGAQAAQGDSALEDSYTVAQQEDVSALEASNSVDVQQEEDSALEASNAVDVQQEYDLALEDSNSVDAEEEDDSTFEALNSVDPQQEDASVLDASTSTASHTAHLLEEAWSAYDQEAFSCKFLPKEYLRIIVELKLKYRGVSCIKNASDYNLFVVGKSAGKHSHACDSIDLCELPQFAFLWEGVDKDGHTKRFTIKQGSTKETAAFPCSREKSIKLIAFHLISCGIEPLAFMHGNEIQANNKISYSKTVCNSISKSGYYVSQSSMSFLLENEFILELIYEQHAKETRLAIGDPPDAADFVGLSTRIEDVAPLGEQLVQAGTATSTGNEKDDSFLQALINVLAPGHDNLSFHDLTVVAEALKASNFEKDIRIAKLEKEIRITELKHSIEREHRNWARARLGYPGASAGIETLASIP